jgi:hypothetical protein
MEWSERSRLAHLAMALAHALVMDHKTPHSLCPSCFHRMRPGGGCAILHPMTFLWPRTTMTFPSVAPRRWRSTCFSTCESLVTNGWEGCNGRRASPHPSNYWLGKTLRRGSYDSSDEWMTLQPCKWKCKLPATHKLAWCMTSSVTSRLTLMLKSCKDLCMGEMPGASVWVLACLIPFPAFPVILSLVSLVVSLQLSWMEEWIASSS